ncbi:hypothetical protein SEA_XAVIA_60 [Mycobacterium phage Xavia]|uniref:Uncharacterized protein n=2 Tax=Caudoviricetes TaxID=2731619 RepID=A0A076G897_9CAUD|nr:hypothetical protein VC74_gp61 [Mycobacterium phage Sparky]YP_009965267.1 hypothetical protein I5J51_gp60 [Mycobacterium phage Xavia]AII28209.1 hypothetical protein PBI_SPARKY_65 [Mycobacterium phage Sparky]AWN02661.1 hypothetical protein SEA_XAVIA_60 [Mycobacterium phage Xavia]
MTVEQLAFDLTLPSQPAVIEQVAVVFTAVGGRDKGMQVYHVHPDPEWYRADVAARQRKAGMKPDAQVMKRVVTCGPWRPA